MLICAIMPYIAANTKKDDNDAQPNAKTVTIVNP